MRASVGSGLPGWRQHLPGPVGLATTGLASITLLVGFAIAVRGPVGESDAEAAVIVADQTNLPDAGDDADAPIEAEPAASADPNAPRRAAWRELERQVKRGQYVGAVASLEELVELDPKALDDGDVRAAVIELSQRASLIEGDAGDRVFALLTDRTGTKGLDVLYELVTTKGGSKAAKRAEDFLKDDAVRAKGSGAMQVAYELRAARCSQKPNLFERAKNVGDSRALGQLQLLNQSCGRRNQSCCYPGDVALKDAIEAIRVRIR